MCVLFHHCFDTVNSFTGRTYELIPGDSITVVVTGEASFANCYTPFTLPLPYFKSGGKLMGTGRSTSTQNGH